MPNDIKLICPEGQSVRDVWKSLPSTDLVIWEANISVDNVENTKFQVLLDHWGYASSELIYRQPLPPTFKAARFDWFWIRAPNRLPIIVFDY